MTADELKAARHSLGLSAEAFARAFGIASGRTVRGWESGERNGKAAPVPDPVALLVQLALALPAARAWIFERQS
jgi:transcriptional regulator with XRE-family HTH domain